MKLIGIRANLDKVAKAQVLEIEEWLKGNGIKTCVMNEEDPDLPSNMDLLLVMGGDGTLLGAARAAAAKEIPLIGVDFGGLGYLCELKFGDTLEALADILNGKYTIEERWMLESVVSVGGENKTTIPCMNDIVITKKTGRMLRLKVFINDEYFTEFPGDGLIVSSATGSTAYSLSAGGPIVKPGLDVILITPICPHTLFARSIVAEGSDEIRVQLPTGRKDLIITVDGQEEHNAGSGGEVLIRRSKYSLKLARVRPQGFLQTLREKFHLD